MTEGQMSNPSEKMLIEHDFVDGTVVRVNIPPKGTPQPEKISIRELILYSEKDLPDYVKYLLCEMEHYAQKDEYARMARSLVLASATNSERDYRNYLEAVRQTRGALAIEAANGMPKGIQEFLRSKIEEIQTKMAKPYQKDNFADLCDSIDELYDELGVYTTTDDQGLSAVEQIGKNVADFLDGKGLTIGTKATNMILLHSKELTKLELILSKADEYPEVIEAEFGKNFGRDWLHDCIECLYADQINYYMEETIPFFESITQFYDYLKTNADQQTEDDQRTLEYVELLYGFVNDQPENVIRLLLTCGDILAFLLENCSPNDKKGNDLKEDVRSKLIQLKNKIQLKHLRGGRDLRISMTPIADQTEYEELKTALTAFKENMDLLRKRFDLYHQDAAKILESRKDRITHHIKKFFVVKSLTEEKRDIRSEIRFKILLKIAETCRPQDLLQLACNSSHTIYFLEKLFNCESLGGSNYHYVEYEKNVAILKASKDIILDIRKKYCSREKERDYSNFIPHQTEMDDKKASRILEHQKRQIEANYEQVPDYIRKIIDYKNGLPNHVKAMFLNNVLQPSRFFLTDYVSGDYAKRIITAEAQEEFKFMPVKAQKLFLEILMNQELPIAGTLPSTRFMIAYRMNFPEGATGKSFISEADFFLMMTKFHIKEIRPYDLQEFLDAGEVIKLITTYVEWHPNDTEAAAQAIPQIEHFLNFCKNYLSEHVQQVKIEKGERPLSSFLTKALLRREMKEKSLLEQLIVKYEFLYSCHDYIKFKSGWCEMEQELFDEIITKIGQESPKVQEKACKELWFKMFYKLPYYDVIAEHLMAIKPSCTQKQYDSMMSDFHRHCISRDRKIMISNPSVLIGLETIRDLFAKYGQNVEVLFNGQPTAFIDILIRVHNIVQCFNGQEARVTIRKNA